MGKRMQKSLPDPYDNREDDDGWAAKVAVGCFLVTAYLSMIFEWKIGEIYLGSPGGTTLQFLFWVVMGALLRFFSGHEDK